MNDVKGYILNFICLSTYTSSLSSPCSLYFLLNHLCFLLFHSHHCHLQYTCFYLSDIPSFLYLLLLLLLFFIGLAITTVCSGSTTFVCPKYKCPNDWTLRSKALSPCLKKWELYFPLLTSSYDLCSKYTFQFPLRSNPYKVRTKGYNLDNII